MQMDLLTLQLIDLIEAAYGLQKPEEDWLRDFTGARLAHGFRSFDLPMSEVDFQASRAGYRANLTTEGGSLELLRRFHD